MPDTYSLLHIIGEKPLRRALHAFTASTGMPVLAQNAAGSECIPKMGQDSQSAFCRIIQSTPEGRARCLESINKAGKQAAKLGEPYIHQCHAGMIRISAPLMLEDTYLGCLSCGPMIMWEWDEVTIQDILKRTATLCPPEPLIVASHEIQTVDSGRAQALADLLFMTAISLAHASLTTLERNRELNEQQARLAEDIYASKQRSKTISVLEMMGQPGNYPLEMERALLGKVRLGDRSGAKEILNEMLGSIFFRSTGNNEVMKARLLELVVVISRAAVEGGASLSKLFGLNFHFIEELYSLDRFDDMCIWLIKVLDTFIDTVFETRNIKNARSLSAAMQYIRDNYMNNVSLENVAQHVFISPYYLSHLFKDELGITFVEYLTQVRIERARELLQSTGMSIVAIATEVGYEDASYFSKVFRKRCGLSPNLYRRQHS